MLSIAVLPAPTMTQPRQRAGRHQAHALGNLELRRMGGRDRRPLPARIDDAFVHFDLRRRPRQQRLHHACAAVFVHRQPAHAATGVQALKHTLEVGIQLGAAGQFREAGVQAGAVELAAAQRQRVDAVEGRGLVQPHKGVGVAPVATGLAAAVHERQRGGRILLDQ
jgi:hypothetical protein